MTMTMREKYDFEREHASRDMAKAIAQPILVVMTSYEYIVR